MKYSESKSISAVLIRGTFLLSLMLGLAWVVLSIGTVLRCIDLATFAAMGWNIEWTEEDKAEFWAALTIPASIVSMLTVIPSLAWLTIVIWARPKFQQVVALRKAVVAIICMPWAAFPSQLALFFVLPIFKF